MVLIFFFVDEDERVVKERFSMRSGSVTK